MNNCLVCLVQYLGYAYILKKSLFIWNSNLIGHSMFDPVTLVWWQFWVPRSSLLLLLLLLLLSCFSHVQFCATPWIAALQAPPSLGFSRQEHWSGLPFPSPMHESEKWKWSCSVVSDLATPWTAAYQASPSKDFPGKSTGVGCHCLLCRTSLVMMKWAQADNSEKV